MTAPSACLAILPVSRINQQRAQSRPTPLDVMLSDFDQILGLGLLYDFESEFPEPLMTKDPTVVENPPHIKHIGFTVHKTEIDKENNATTYPVQFIPNIAQTEFIDVKVTYGYRYTYKIKAVFAIEEYYRVTGKYFW